MTTIMQTPNRKELTRDRIVGVAARAIRRSGYRGTGVADIMKEAGLTHGGFYAHFDSRDALVVEAMQRAGRENVDGLTAAMDRLIARDGGTRFDALVRVYLHDAHLERVEDGCVVAALASETTRQDEAVRDEARRRVATLVELVRSTLPPEADPGRAERVTATMVGALQLARTLGGRAGRDLLARTRDALRGRDSALHTP